MSQVSSEHPQESGKNSTKSSERSAPNKNVRPGWPEIFVGLVVWSIAVFALSPQLERLDLDPRLRAGRAKQRRRMSLYCI